MSLSECKESGSIIRIEREKIVFVVQPNKKITHAFQGIVSEKLEELCNLKWSNTEDKHNEDSEQHFHNLELLMK